MTKQSVAVSVVLLLLCSLALPAQKKVPPKTIRFQGTPQYTQQELLAAAGLTPDARLSPRDVKAHAKQLSDTGLFEVVNFRADSKGLLFTLTPSSKLFPIHLENVPLTPGKELDAKIHDRFPLYRSLLPGSGSMVEGICQTFEEMLAAKGVKATVKAALTSGLGPQKITAMNFTVVTPEVHIGRIQLTGVSSAMQAKASLLASGQTGNGFDTENTAIGLQHAFEELYQDQGYAAVQVDVVQGDPAVVQDQAVDIPFAVTIREGGIYKLGTIDFPGNTLVARAEVEKIRSKYPSASGRPLDLFLLAVRDACHAHGYLDCTVVAHPSFNEAGSYRELQPRNRSGLAVPAGLGQIRWSSRRDGCPTEARLEDGSRRRIRRKLRLELCGGGTKKRQDSGEMDADRHHYLRCEGRPWPALGQLHLPLRQSRSGRAVSTFASSEMKGSTCWITSSSR